MEGKAALIAACLLLAILAIALRKAIHKPQSRHKVLFADKTHPTREDFSANSLIMDPWDCTDPEYDHEFLMMLLRQEETLEEVECIIMVLTDDLSRIKGQGHIDVPIWSELLRAHERFRDKQIAFLAIAKAYERYHATKASLRTPKHDNPLASGYDEFVPKLRRAWKDVQAAVFARRVLEEIQYLRRDCLRDRAGSDELKAFLARLDGRHGLCPSLLNATKKAAEDNTLAVFCWWVEDGGWCMVLAGGQ